MPTDTKKPGRVIAARSAFVLSVRPPRHVSEVRESVVGLDAVDVVDLLSGPRTSDMQPRESVGFVSAAINSDLDVSITIDSSSNSAGWKPSMSTCGIDPGKKTCFWIVVKQLAQSLRGKIRISHEALLSLSGQRLAGAQHAVRASLF